MSYTEAEADYFFWHCACAALVLEKLVLNTATRVHLNNAIRMATLNAVGKNGIRLASPSAAEQISLTTRAPTAGLVREHVVPVSVIAGEVEAIFKAGTLYAWRELVPFLRQEDLVQWEVIDSDDFLDSAAPLSAVIASIVRERSLLAWVTKRDEAILRKAGYAKAMPSHLPDDPRGRYTACGIELVDIEVRSPRRTTRRRKSVGASV